MSDEQKSKGISLRRKKTAKPKISAPRPIAEREISNPSIISNDDSSIAAGTVTPRQRPSISGGDKTSDLVKRRYSTRFTGPGFSTDAGLAPPVPNLPSQYGRDASSRGVSTSPQRRAVGASPERGSSPGRGEVRIDMNALKDPDLQPDQYVATVLADASEGDIAMFQSNLQNVKASASVDLQHNVYQNRTQFIKISKEADKLKSELRMLRSLMGELTGALGHATSAGGAEPNGSSQYLSVADRKRANRSSIANLEALWSTQLQAVWKRIEGSQKYLPALPGRHIITESHRWVELNSATWKGKRRVVLLLLNDHLLVASEKKRNDMMAAQGQSPASKRQSVYVQPSQQITLVAERCWPLQDVKLADISADSLTSAKGAKESPQLKNAINIRAAGESFTFATGDGAEKAALVVAFRKAQEDLRKQMAAEHGERERAMEEFALLTGREPRALKKVNAAANALDTKQDETATKTGATLSGLSRSNSVIVDTDGRQQSVRWVESQIDELDINIALQRFEEAVAGVEKLRRLARSIARQHAAVQDIVQARVNERVGRLAGSISRQLRLVSFGAERTKQSVSWLLRLGHEDLARSTYLSSRAETIRLRVRQLPFNGPLPPYLHALAFTTFTLLLHTFRTFTSSFPSASGSGVVKWAKERVDEFNDVLGRQLSSVETGGELWTECVEVVRNQANVLNEVSVDLSWLVARGLTIGTEPEDTTKAQRSDAKGHVGLGLRA